MIWFVFWIIWSVIWTIMGILLVIDAVKRNHRLKEERTKVAARKVKKEALTRQYQNECTEKKQSVDAQINAVRANYDQFCRECQNEIDRAAYLKKKSYGTLDIIPSPFRNLKDMLYIYDCVSTSDAPLTKAFDYAHLESGIRRVGELLRELRGGQDIMILENRKMQSTLDSGGEYLSDISRNQCAMKSEMKNQNMKILKHCQRIESNTAKSAVYAELASDYAEANAFFALANYLDK